MSEITIDKLLALFKGDKRRVMKQNLNSYSLLHEGEINLTDWENHLKGHSSIAIYLLDENRNCSTICLDIDIPKIEVPDTASLREKVKKDRFFPEVLKIVSYLVEQYNISKNSFLIEDTGGRGYHIWMFFAKPLDGGRVVTFLNEVKINCGFENLEIFPPTSSHGGKGFSKSLVRLPLGVHKKYNSARSHFIDIFDYKTIEQENIDALLNKIEFVNEEVLLIAENKYKKILESKTTRIKYVKAKAGIVDSENFSLGEIGDMTRFCPAIQGLIIKAKKDRDLKHHERFALAAILKHFSDGEQMLHEILSNCSNYNLEKSSSQISSIKALPISCRKLQSTEYQICSGWCNKSFEMDLIQGRRPSPIFFANLNTDIENVKLDTATESDLQRTASLENLLHAWKQAKQQSKDRDVFEDVLAFDLFESDLWNNLQMLNAQLLNRSWKHNNFLLVEIPKQKEDESVRPFCSISPREAIIELAILNSIGPKIDSRFLPNSLGNRLAITPKSDSQIFQDWRKQNGIREFKKKGFSEYESHNHYVLTDIKRFYEFIRHDKLMLQLRQFVEDQDILDLIQQFIEAPWERAENEYGGKLKEKGIPQGPALSALLANIYLHEVDEWLSRNCITFVRYVDDIAILFEDKESADATIKALKAQLKDNYGLSLNGEKTSDPEPITNSEKLTNWLDEIRYDFVKSNSASTPVNEFEKKDLLDTLNRLAGNIDEDIKNLTKYLGFYIRFSEKLEDTRMLKTVYAMAAFILNEDRPKHNATSIAVRALIKSCNEIESDTWAQLDNLICERKDEYFKVVFCQETYKILLNDGDAEIDPNVINKIFEFAGDENNPIAAAAALNTLKLIDTSATTFRDLSNLFQVAIGGKAFLSPRAVFILSRWNRINETFYARLLPRSLFEIEVTGTLIEKSAVGFFNLLVVTVKENRNYLLALPLIVRKAILLTDKAGIALFNVIEDQQQGKLAHYIAEKVIESVLFDSDASEQLHKVTGFLATEHPVLWSKIYEAGRLYKLLQQDESFSNVEELNNVDSSLLAHIAFKGVVLKEPLVYQNRFVHIAEDDMRNDCYHEIIDSNEIMKAGKSTHSYKAVIDELQKNELLLPCEYELKASQLLIKTIISSEYITIKSFLQTTVLTPSKVYQTLKNIVILVQQATNLLNKIKEIILVPTPTTHTIFINKDGDLKFGVASLTIGSERKYIGLTGEEYKLQIDEWLIESIGLLFFELTNNECAAKEIIRDGVIKKEKINNYEPRLGSLFIDIVKKATKFAPSDRYANLSFLIDDIEEWNTLETAFGTLPDLPEGEKCLLRILWSLDITTERRVLSDSKHSEDLLSYSHKIKRAIISQLVDKEVHLNIDFKSGWELIENGNIYDKHVASYQAIKLANSIEKKIGETKKIMPLKRDISLSLWLQTSAASVELEALRRSLFQIVVDSRHRDEFVRLQTFINDEIASGQKLSLFTQKVTNTLTQAIISLEYNIGDLNNRLEIWNSKSKIPSVKWTFDILVIILIIVSKYFGMKIISTSEKAFELRPDKRLFNRVEIELIIQKLLSVLDSDLNRLKSNSQVFGLGYNTFVHGNLNEVNLHILRNVYRCFDVLHRSITNLQFGEEVTLNIKTLQKTASLSKDVIVNECHQFNKYHTVNCPFSIDMQIISNKRYRPIIASFPILACRDADSTLYPKLDERKTLFWFEKNILNYRRRRPIRSAFLDTHAFLLLGTGVLLFFAIHWQSETTNTYKQVALNIFIYSFCLSPAGLYLKISKDRLVTSLQLKNSFKLFFE